jgi:hypothetical protein
MPTKGVSRVTYLGKMQGGTVVFEGEKPEEGAVVRVEPVETAAADMTVGQRLLKWAGVIEDGPADASLNVDHYLYGLPKK